MPPGLEQCWEIPNVWIYFKAGTSLAVNYNLGVVVVAPGHGSDDGWLAGGSLG